MNGDEQNQIPSEPNAEQASVVANSEPFTDSKPIPAEKSKNSSINKVQNFDAHGVTLTQDDFALFYDEDGNRHSIKRFTWKNKNRIEIQVLNYGARVISIKLPDRKGEIEDILLGFDDLGGYLFYDKLYFGAVIGRMSNVVKNSTISIGNKKYNVEKNFGNHSFNGGRKGLDKVIWDTYVTGRKVIMSYVSPHLSEGYPGDLLIRAIFELSAKNEFKVSFEAQTTHPTCVDLSHLLYFNLAGHHTGPDEIYRHILTLNCNCFTPQINKIPTGEILNVIHSQYDFQVPKILGKVIGVSPKDGFDQNLCVNRGMYQQECFVSRILHPPSGRMLEIYSNQPGVRLDTANDFGYGNILTFDEIQKQAKAKEACHNEEILDNSMMILFQKVHEKVAKLLELDEQQNFTEIINLILKFSTLKTKNDRDSLDKLVEQGFQVTPLQNQYLIKAKEIICEDEETDDDCLNLKEALSAILEFVQVIETPSPETSRSSFVGVAELDQTVNAASKKPSVINTLSIKSTASSKIGVKPSNNDGIKEIQENPGSSSQVNSPKQSKSESGKIKLENVIPVYYKNSNQILGKGRALYKMHGAIALQTQNYPNAVNIKQFPNCILNPGEVYKHDIVYRFWIRAGNPNKWIKRNMNESKQQTSKK